MLHKVTDLPVATRAVVETLVGRPLAENETVSIRPYHVQKEGADALTAAAVADRLQQLCTQIDQQRPPLENSDEEAALDEAIRAVRSGHKSHR